MSPSHTPSRRCETDGASALRQKGDGAGNSFYVTWREYMFQVAITAEAILDLGWPSDHVGLDQGDTTFDLGLFSGPEAAATMRVAIEVKKTDPEFESLMTEPAASRARPPRLDTASRRNAIGTRYFGRLDEQPMWFWAVAPHVRTCFAVRSGERTAQMIEVGDAPPRFPA